MKTEDLKEFVAALEGIPPSLSPKDRLDILTLCQTLVVEKKFGIFRLVDLCAAFESYVLSGAFPVDFAANYKTLIEKQGFPYKGPSPFAVKGVASTVPPAKP